MTFKTDGFEDAVLKGVDFKQHRPWILVIASTKSTQDSYEQWEPFLLHEGYLFAYADGLNRFYVAIEQALFMSFFMYPPHALDDSILSSYLSLQLRAESAEAALRLVYASTCWQITEPCRMIINESRAFIKKIKSHRLLNKKNMAIFLLNHLVFFIKQHPMLKQLMRRLLSSCPRLRDRLLFKKKLNCFSVTHAADLSARARDVYESLKIAEENKNREP